MFITLEANEGAGKTVQARRLHDALTARGHDAILTREPGGSPAAEDIRKLIVCGDPDSMDAQTETLLLTAARRVHLQQTVLPALEAGKIVVCDRYLGSTHALQGAAGVSGEEIESLFERYCGTRPDLTLFLDIDLETAFARRASDLATAAPGEAEDRFERKGIAYHRRIDTLFRAQAAREPSWVTIDATGSIDTVAERILRAVEARLGTHHQPGAMA